MLHITGLAKAFNDGQLRRVLFESLDLQVDSGQSVAIRGESGSGKSTLLHLIAALEKPDAGQILMNRVQVDTFSESEADRFRRQTLGIIFQHFNLIDCLNVWDNVAFPARLKGNQDADYIAQLLDALEIRQHSHKLPVNLSGGEQQRVAIARALAHKPELILADEPTGNLDPRHGKDVCELLYSLCQAQSTSLIMVTHSETVAAGAERSLMLRDGLLAEQE